MAGTSTNRDREFERVNRSESNTYYDGAVDSQSPMKSGFVPGKGARGRKMVDPASTSSTNNGAPNGRGGSGKAPTRY